MKRRSVWIIVAVIAIAALPVISIDSLRNRVLDSVPRPDGWHHLHSTYRRMYVGVDTQTHTMWFTRPSGRQQLGEFKAGQNTLEFFDIEHKPRYPCYGGRVWLPEMMDETLVSIDPETQKEIEHNEIPKAKYFSCEGTYQDQILLWNSQQLIIITGTTFSENYWTLNEKLAYVTQDMAGVTWAYTGAGSIYTLLPGQNLQLAAKIDGDLDQWSALGATTDSLWFHNRNKEILRIGPGHQSIEKVSQDLGEPLSRLSRQSSIYEVGSGIVWLVRKAGIWQHQNGEITPVQIPPYTEEIISSAFDPGLKRVYIATDRGIYFKKLDFPTR